MAETPSQHGASWGFRGIAVFIAVFFALWTGAWLLHNLLAQTVWPALNDSGNQNLLYWCLAKILVWVGYPFLYAKLFLHPENTPAFLGLQNLRRGIAAGLVAGLVWIGLAFLLQGPPSREFTFSFTLLWVVTGTPIAEEFTFRGIIQPGLQQTGMGFWKTNVLTSVVFVLIHVVGWAFQGALAANVNIPIVGGILLVSLFAGCLRHKTDSLYAPIILHALNNLFSSMR